jgi:hypothetical protein
LANLRILLWHGYLLGGTGSNVYTRALAREWSNAGHDVVVISQEPHPEQYDLGRATTVRPELDGPLPVFVLDRYEGHEPRLLQELTLEERERYVERNAAVVRGLLPADLVFANHVLPGAAVGAASGARFAVKAHGSELEYSRRSPEPRRSSSARSTSARCSRTSSATSIASTRCRPEWTSTSFDRDRDGRRSPRS